MDLKEKLKQQKQKLDSKLREIIDKRERELQPIVAEIKVIDKMLEWLNESNEEALYQGTRVNADAPALPLRGGIINHGAGTRKPKRKTVKTFKVRGIPEKVKYLFQNELAPNVMVTSKQIANMISQKWPEARCKQLTGLVGKALQKWREAKVPWLGFRPGETNYRHQYWAIKIGAPAIVLPATDKDQKNSRKKHKIRKGLINNVKTALALLPADEWHTVGTIYDHLLNLCPEYKPDSKFRNIVGQTIYRARITNASWLVAKKAPVTKQNKAGYVYQYRKAG